MGRGRLYRRWSGLLALSALALQLALSFGHIHLEDIAAGPAAVAALARPAAPAAPPDAPGHDEDAARHCDICATLHALGTAQIPAPPVLILPVAFALAPPAMHCDVPVARARCAAFRSRAPPSA
jgi:hypothetical protein